ncbi:MAG: UvrD-helicase domain-containing protein [Desertifilum sp.]|nr:UvrD-helicase domain-containing protein [Desertifilum sp.]
MELSSYQQSIIDWVKNGKGHGCCNAVAGSGKSTTLRLAAIALEESGISPSTIKICVFGKANATDLISKFGKAWESSISTLHSAGWTLLKEHLGIKNPQGLIKSNKYKAIAQDMGLLSKRGVKGSLQREKLLTQEGDFTKLLDLVRLTNQFPSAEAIRDICAHFDFPDVREYSIIASAIAQVLGVGERQAKDRSGMSFDFCDQIWLPVLWGLKPSQPYKFVLVDECQDLNAAQLELVLSLAGDDGRILAVGDPRQAIMGFAGADNRSYQKIVERLQAVELPLSICYRCPKSAIALVKENFPEIPIEAATTATAGNIEAISEADLWSDKPCSLLEGDLVLSRKTAPLVSLCIRLIAKGIAATVKGKAIGEQIKGDLEEIAKIPGFRFSEFPDAVNVYRLAKSSKYSGFDNAEQLIEQLNDKLEALLTIYKSLPNATCVSDLSFYIEALFSDEHSPVTLSTCHRAKGLEAERVFLIRPEDLPMVWRNQQEWQLEQENNLLYVALTRTKAELFVVGNPGWLTVKANSEVLEEEASADQAQPLAQPEIIEIPIEPIEQPKIIEIPVEPIEQPEQFPAHLKAIAELMEQEETVNPTVTGDSPKYSERLVGGIPVRRELLANPHRSDRAIAALCGVSAPTIGKWRKRLLQQGLIESNGKRIDKNGRTLNTTNIGKPERSPQEKIMEIAETLSPVEIDELIAALSHLL